MSYKCALVYSVLINLFFLMLCLIFGDLKFGAIDDYFMAARLTGALGTDYNPHLIFVNAVYGYALLPLYHLFPKIGWYYIGEMFSVFLSFTVIGYVLLERCGVRWGAILATMFTALFASDFYLVVQFTQCASILSAAGMLLFAYGIIMQSRRTFPFVLGVILMLWGSVMRWQAFLMGLPFFCLEILFIIKVCWKIKWKVIASLFILFVGVQTMHHWDKKIYEVPKYATFVKIQPVRSLLGDVSNYNKNAVYEDAEELGLSGKDFHMLTELLFYDTEVFSFDSIVQYTNIISTYKKSFSLQEFPSRMLYTLRTSLHSPLFWTWFILCLLVYATNRPKGVYIWTSFGLVLVLMASLLFMGRLVYRVESGFWLYAAVLAIPLYGKFTVNISQKITCAVISVITTANVFTYATNGDVVRDPSSGKTRTLAIDDSTNYTQVFDYIDREPDKMFMLSMNAFMRFSHHRNPPFLAEPIGVYRRTTSFGYWTPYLPEISTNLADFGIVNPVKDVVNDNVIVLNEPGLSDFLQRHHYDSISVDTLKKIGEMTFLKYRIVQDKDSVIRKAE